jgi:hypothetical protein
MTTGNDGARADVELTEAEVTLYCAHPGSCTTIGASTDRCIQPDDPAMLRRDAERKIKNLAERLRQVEAERDAYRKAKQENDERFQIEAGEQRERAEQAEAALAEARQREERVRALAEEWDGTVYKLPSDHPMTVNEFCAHWFKRPLRKALGGDDA